MVAVPWDLRLCILPTQFRLLLEVDPVSVQSRIIRTCLGCLFPLLPGQVGLFHYIPAGGGLARDAES